MAVAVVTGAVVLEGCKGDPASPGFEYMPDMYRSASYKAYEETAFGDSIEARLPVSGTIPRGGMYTSYVPYPYANTPEGYEASAVNKNPFTVDAKFVAEGARLYNIFCVHCHGEKGDGQGILAQRGKFTGVPSYKSAALANLPEGKIYHVITNGKGMMGSHASQLNQTERWHVVSYVQTLQKGDAAAAPVAAAADSTKK